MGICFVVSGDPLDDVKVTAERVERFAAEVEREGSVENRKLWRAALGDLRHAIRNARERGFATDAIQKASGDQPSGHFVRPPAPVEQDTHQQLPH